MDVVRTRRGPSKQVITLLAVTLLFTAVAASLLSLFRSHEKGPSVDRSSVVTDVVRFGTIDRSVTAAGNLASRQVRVVSAGESGTIASVFVKPGATVRGGDPIARLDNPDLDAAVVDARSALQVSIAQLGSAREQARASLLTQQAALAGAQAQMEEDQTNAQSLDSLHRSGLIANSTYSIAKIRSAQSRRQVEISHSQLQVDLADQQAKIAAAQAQVDEASAQLTARQAHVDALIVRAGADGVVQSIGAEPGSHVDAGAELARLANQNDLKAVLQVPEGDVHDVRVGMLARIDTGSDEAFGRVDRIAPTAQNGTVFVDVCFDRTPGGASTLKCRR